MGFEPTERAEHSDCAHGAMDLCDPPEFSMTLGCDPESLSAYGRPVRLGILGGTFDPLHVGHIACAQAALEACNLDKVLFIPAGNPHFKQGRRLVPAEDRLRWCRKALDRYSQFGVCDIEVRRKGVTYTVDTLRQLRSCYSDNVEFWFVVGADSAASLLQWRESEALAQLATYVVVSRPGSTFDEKTRLSLLQAGFRLEFVDTACADVSSSAIRARLAAGEFVDGLVPEAIRFGVECRAQYYKEALAEEAATLTEEALSEGFFEARKAELAQRVSPKRFEHVLGVVEACARLARVYGVDERKARLAGLLHDWDKGYDDAGIRARVAELGLVDALDAWVIENMPQVLHAHTAACALQQEFPQLPPDIVRAIDRHTTAAADMSSLEMVLYVADAIEDGRQFGRIDELRAAVGQVSLEELFFLTYEYWVLLLFERRKQLHPDTIAIWNELVARRAAGKGRE